MPKCHCAPATGNGQNAVAHPSMASMRSYLIFLECVCPRHWLTLKVLGMYSKPSAGSQSTRAICKYHRAAQRPRAEQRSKRRRPSLNGFDAKLPYLFGMCMPAPLAHFKGTRNVVGAKTAGAVPETVCVGKRSSRGYILYIYTIYVKRRGPALDGFVATQDNLRRIGSAMRRRNYYLARNLKRAKSADAVPEAVWKAHAIARGRSTLCPPQRPKRRCPSLNGFNA
jgi:hypothetical protein